MFFKILIVLSLVVFAQASFAEESCVVRVSADQRESLTVELGDGFVNVAFVKVLDSSAYIEANKFLTEGDFTEELSPKKSKFKVIAINGAGEEAVVEISLGAIDKEIVVDDAYEVSATIKSNLKTLTTGKARGSIAKACFK